MTPDHISVTPYYDEPQTTDDQIASLPELKWDQKIVGDVKVSLLGDDAALRTFTPTSKSASRANHCRPKCSRPRLKRNGKWIERFYQETLSNRAKPVTVHAGTL